ncbi:hypothetical protein NC653_034823 [Populus alba x Populus x berolinensis]|uniref:Uncharacterized protein n=1 Tax=Populus alba x Populus x berolinensis TaxID=444605 RepID=A0AAD6LND7_9ROSI|nr:hypothetical protein NC653_034823 [Populus alba x Populus x berolinensis]
MLGRRGSISIIFFFFFSISHQPTKAIQFFFSFFPLHISNIGSLFSS